MTDGGGVNYPEEIKELKADSRGRVNLGTGYAGKTAKVAVLEVVGSDD